MHLKRYGKRLEGRDRYVLFASLNATNIRAIDAGLQCEPLLR